jgi:predicted amidohydrolase
MIVAGLQLDIAWERPAENFHRAEALAREAVDRGARVLVLPELFATGFSMRSEAMAAPPTCGPSSPARLSSTTCG